MKYNINSFYYLIKLYIDFELDQIEIALVSCSFKHYQHYQVVSDNQFRLLAFFLSINLKFYLQKLKTMNNALPDWTY